MPSSRTCARDMFPLIERYLDRDGAQKAFCRAHGLSLNQLNYWLAKYRRAHAEEPAGPTRAFQEITPAVSSADAALMEIVFPHSVRLRLFAPVEPTYLERLLAPRRPGR